MSKEKKQRLYHDAKLIVKSFKHFAAALEDDIFDDFCQTFNASNYGLFVYRPGNEQLPLLVAHVDTVFSEPVNVEDILYDPKAMVIFRRPVSRRRFYIYSRAHEEGLGADDRLGVALISILASEFPDVGILLTDLEESGGYGAIDAARVLGDELARYPYFLQLDRCGAKHFAHYDTLTPQFKTFLSKHLPHWHLERGSFTDIAHLCPVIGRCGVNIAIGYYNQHTELEYIEVRHAVMALRAVRILLQVPCSSPFPLKRVISQHNWDADWYYDWVEALEEEQQDEEAQTDEQGQLQVPQSLLPPSTSTSKPFWQQWFRKSHSSVSQTHDPDENNTPSNEK
ncbi:MAG: hypothetical protein QW104_07215 [Nitrososphaerota archaeon]